MQRRWTIKKVTCSNCEQVSQILTKDGYCPTCDNWLSLSPTERAKSLRSVAREYPEDCQQRRMILEQAAKLEKEG